MRISLTFSQRILNSRSGKTVQPLVVDDIGGDNYEYLYLGTDETTSTVSIKGGLLVDPRLDANPTSKVTVVNSK